MNQQESSKVARADNKVASRSPDNRDSSQAKVASSIQDSRSSSPDKVVSRSRDRAVNART